MFILVCSTGDIFSSPADYSQGTHKVSKIDITQTCFTMKSHESIKHVKC